MHPFHYFLVISTVTGWAMSQDEPVRAVLDIARGASEVLVGESVTLNCSIPGDPSLQWTHRWLKDGAMMHSQSFLDDELTLTPLLPKESGLYACQGLMMTQSKERLTLPSHPLQISVHVGWAVLQVSHKSPFAGESMTLVCHVRGSPILTEVVFYKDGAELQRSARRKLHLVRLTQEDQGSYWCRATWRRRMDWSSALSLAVQVFVTEVLTEPVMEVLPEGPAVLGQVLNLRCRVQVNVQWPGLQVIYQYLRDGRRLGVATSKDQRTVLLASPQDFGLYQCKVSVGGLDQSKSSNKVPVAVIAGV